MEEEEEDAADRPEAGGGGAGGSVGEHGRQRDPVVVCGAGPAGLFAALAVAEAGLPVLLLERGQPVEARGRDIGALIARRQLNPESNFCYGEPGALIATRPIVNPAFSLCAGSV